MKRFVCWLWTTPERPYLPKHVNSLAEQIKQFTDIPLTCITDEKGDFSPLVEVIPTPPESAKFLTQLKTPEGEGFPSCYRRLWLFSPEAKRLGHVMLLDIDVKVIGDLSVYFTKSTFGAVKATRKWGNEGRIAGGTFVLRTGNHPELWEALKSDPIKLIQETREMGWRGSDQAILSRYMHDKGELLKGIIFTNTQGIPEGTRLINYNGHWGEKNLE